MTYADNYACEFFKKQGFLKEISLEKWKWEGYIKEYKNGTLMEYLVNPNTIFKEGEERIERQKNLLL